ncbi:MAG: hypothetical protein JWR15_2784, partial [Prosthecobacter sp.]|nr:hypothetical protein [Prosthecobacter sp.]
MLIPSGKGTRMVPLLVDAHLDLDILGAFLAAWLY